jgi:uncharacterized protein YbjT (DUF2867 family)
MSNDSALPTVVIGGGSGFVGQALAAQLSRRFRVIGLSRSEKKPDAHVSEWRKADLFNLREAEEGLHGAKYAVYLVHSMLPSARLTQGTFEDLDLICADNFARAAKRAGVEQIVFLGGLLPERRDLSPHLASRLEVEETLGRYGVPVHCAPRRARDRRWRLVVRDAHGRLVRRLPVMIVPKWTLTKTQPVGVDDVVALLSFVVGHEPSFGETYDVGARERIDYRTLMAMCTELLGLSRPMVSVPLFTPGLSRLWVSLVTGAPKALVAPLVESLRHEMLARDHRIFELAGREPTPLREAMSRALAEESGTPRAYSAPTKKGETRPSLVRSVQTHEAPRSPRRHLGRRRVRKVAPARAPRPRPRRGGQGRDVTFFLVLFRIPLLVLTYAPERSTPDRQLFFVTGGALSRADYPGRFELRQVLDGRTLLTAIHDFARRGCPGSSMSRRRPSFTRGSWLPFVCTWPVAERRGRGTNRSTPRSVPPQGRPRSARKPPTNP